MTLATAAGARAEALSAFVSGAGRDPGGLAPLAGDASNRRYLRLSDAHGRAVVMDAPAPAEDVRPFIAVTEELRARGLSAPEILAADIGAGFLLLEDLGDALYARVAAEAGESALYARAVDLLAGRLADPPARIGTGAAARALPPYDRATLAAEARLVTGWYLPGATGGPCPDALTEDLLGLLDAALGPASEDRSALVLRDYHAENLIWLPDRPGLAAVGLLDYQDALAGHPAYDLVSLLEDARRDTAPELRAAMLERFLAARPDLDAEAFRAAFAALGAQRNLKIVGIFTRLCLRDGKPRYLDLVPRVWDHLMRDLSHPALAPVARLVAAHIPPPEPALRARIAAGAGAGA